MVRGFVSIAVFGLVATGCSSGSMQDALPDDDGPVLVYATVEDYSGYMDQLKGYDTMGNYRANSLLGSSFAHMDEDGNNTLTPEFGTFKKISDSPLRVEYTLNPKAVWSDGEPYDCDDVVFAWLLDHPEVSTEYGVEDGFNSVFSLVHDVIKKPECSDGDRTYVLEFADSFRDWDRELVAGFPAHMVEQKSGVADIIAAADDLDGPDIARLAKVFNEGFLGEPGNFPKDMWLSVGPMQISEWPDSKTLVLTRNPNWWGEPAIASEIRYITMSPSEMAPAVARGEVHVAELEPDPELLAQAEALGDAVVYRDANDLAYDALEINHVSGPLADVRLRRALMYCIPRQDILKLNVMPTEGNGELMNARYIFPFEQGYDDIAVGAVPYQDVDLDMARRLVAETGLSTPIDIRLGRWKSDTDDLPLRVQQVALIMESCNRAGFNIFETGSEDFFETDLINGDFDLALYGWSMAAEPVDRLIAFHSTGAQNSGGYANPEVDAAIDELSSTIDLKRYRELLRKAEALMWQDVATIPLGVRKAMWVQSPKLKNVEFNPYYGSVFWSADGWELEES